MLAFLSFQLKSPACYFWFGSSVRFFFINQELAPAPQKGVTDYPLAWRMEHVLFSWSTFMSVCVSSVCVNMCLWVYSRPHVRKCNAKMTAFCFADPPLSPSPLLCSNTGPNQSSPPLAEDSLADRLLLCYVLLTPTAPQCSHDALCEDAECNLGVLQAY